MNARDPLLDLRINPEWGKLPLFDRKDWRTMKFGEFAESINERVEPSDAADEPYVGLDDLDSGDLHIRRWGKGSDVIGTKLRFRKGDIIFGRRRAYQRKLAVAEFDGICSAHAMVVRAKPDVVLPGFLSFFMMTDRFMKRAVEISVGSLSPTINWTTLKLEEFALPSLKQQDHLLLLLQKIEEHLQDTTLLLDRMRAVRGAELCEFIDAQQKPWVPAGDYLEEIQYGSSSKTSVEALPDFLPVIGIPNVIGGAIDYSKVGWLPPDDDNRRYLLSIGDVLIVRTNGNPDYVGRTAVYEGGEYDECLYASYLIRLRAQRSHLLPKFLHELLQAPQIRRELRKQVRSSAGNYNLNTHGIRGLRIPVPHANVQHAFLLRLNDVDTRATLTSEHLKSTGRLRSTVLSML